jgi:membrane-associated protease RseP (regulator of RpoE activity)
VRRITDAAFLRFPGAKGRLMIRSTALAVLILTLPARLIGQRPDTVATPGLGFTIGCTSCVLQDPRYEFTAPPVVTAVRNHSPAARAGLRVGDRITHVGDVDIRTPEGGDLFGHRPRGGTLRLTVEREEWALLVAIGIPTQTADAVRPGE